MSPRARKLLFVDRDGTLIVEPPDQQIDSYEKLALVDGVIPALRRCVAAGYELIMVTNQDGLGTASFPQAAFDGPQNLLLQILRSQGIEFRDIVIDVSFPDQGLDTRKPGTGLMRGYLAADDWSRAASAVIGDRETDLQFAANLGVRGFRLGDDWDWDAIAHALCDAPRRGSVERTTKETRIRVAVDLDRSVDATVATGIGFFDHMLEQIGKHAGIALTLTCAGDSHVDEHHIVEDCALALGEALRTALGEKRGIERYGFTLPMDDCLAQVAIDLGGRSWLVWDVEFHRETIGGVSTEMFFHFFKSFSDKAQCNLNIKAEGTIEHHKIEAIFKAFAKAIKMAVRRDVNNTTLPSTKGSL